MKEKTQTKSPEFCEGEILTINVTGSCFTINNDGTFNKKGKPFQKEETIVILEVNKRGKTHYYLVEYGQNVNPVEMSEHYLSSYKILERTKPHQKTDK